MLTLIAVAVLAVDGGVVAVAPIPHPPPMPPAPKPEPFSIKGTHWGDTVQGVAAVVGELDPIKSSGPIVSYGSYSTLAGHKAAFFWTFLNGGLARVAVKLAEKHSSHDKDVEDYEHIVWALSEKYGYPVTKNDDGKQSGLHIAFGRSERRATWIFGDVQIRARLTGDNAKVESWFMYEDPRVSEQLSKAMSSARTNDL